MDEHLLFYVDLLGTKSTIDDPDETKIQGLEDLLKDIAALRSPFVLKSEERVEDQVYALTIKPEVSTFSDHIVLSLPVAALREVMAENYIFLGVRLISDEIGKLAVQASKLDLLIRGGATIGKLHHHNGVVLGKALVEAYELESRIAIYPRIAVSGKLALSYCAGGKHPPFLAGEDGIKHANYIETMLLVNGEPPKYLAQLRSKVAKNIAAFEANGRLNEMAKWSWFGNAVEKAVQQLPREVFEEVQN